MEVELWKNERDKQNTQTQGIQQPRSNNLVNTGDAKSIIDGQENEGGCRKCKKVGQR